MVTIDAKRLIVARHAAASEQAIAVRCPVDACNASEGQPCRDTGCGESTHWASDQAWSHLARVLRAKEMRA